jgi:hypothetical protein
MLTRSRPSTHCRNHGNRRSGHRQPSGMRHVGFEVTASDYVVVATQDPGASIHSRGGLVHRGAAPAARSSRAGRDAGSTGRSHRRWSELSDVRPRDRPHDPMSISYLSCTLYKLPGAPFSYFAEQNEAGPFEPDGRLRRLALDRGADRQSTATCVQGTHLQRLHNGHTGWAKIHVMPAAVARSGERLERRLLQDFRKHMLLCRRSAGSIIRGVGQIDGRGHRCFVCVATLWWNMAAAVAPWHSPTQGLPGTRRMALFVAKFE